MKDRHVVVLSVDALVYEDLEILSKLYAFEEIWPKTARVNKVKSVYPTITYPCHSTMRTGLYPDRHGILNNEADPEELPNSGRWAHFHEAMKGKSIFEYAKENGLSTAAVCWPVTGNDPNIDYQVCEYWPQFGESTVQCFKDSGSTDEVIEKIVKPNQKLIENRHRMHPWCDEFFMQCACDMLREFKPNLLMIHNGNVDAYRHETGLFTKKVETSLYENNLWFCHLLKAADDAGILDKTDFFVVSDHGQLDITRCVNLNVLLAEKGLIDVDENGKIRDCVAYSKSGGLSALIYLKNKDSVEDYERTKAVLEELKAEEIYGISEIFTEEEARAKHHLGGNFSFVIETDGFTTFGNEWTRPLAKPLDNSDYRVGHATHGHLPEKGPQPTLIAFGPHIKPGVVLENANLVDEAPTFAHALGFEMEDVDGRCLVELFKE